MKWQYQRSKIRQYPCHPKHSGHEKEFSYLYNLQFYFLALESFKLLDFLTLLPISRIFTRFWHVSELHFTAEKLIVNKYNIELRILGHFSIFNFRIKISIFLKKIHLKTKIFDVQKFNFFLFKINSDSI